MHSNLTATTSSTVDAFGFVKDAQNPNVAPASLFVQFKSGKIYRYTVPLSVVTELNAASSKGTYINQMKVVYTGEIVTDDVVTACFAAQTTPSKHSPRFDANLAAKMELKYPVLANFF